MLLLVNLKTLLTSAIVEIGIGNWPYFEICVLNYANWYRPKNVCPGCKRPDDVEPITNTSVKMQLVEACKFLHTVVML